MGQFLLQIDPKTLRSRVDNGTASVRAAEVTLDSMRQAVETGRVQLVQAQQNLKRQQDLWGQQLTTREALDKAVNDLRTAESALSEREKSANAQASRIAQERANLDSAQYDLSQVTHRLADRRHRHRAGTSRRARSVMIGTMNNAGTVLLTLADMSVIEAEVEVDETDIPNVQLGQKAKVTIDALPDQIVHGNVTEIGNSPMQAAAGAAGTAGDQLQGEGDDRRAIPEVRPGFTCTADITTATRKKVVSVPIQAVAVRELIFDAKGRWLRNRSRQEAARRGRRQRTGRDLAVRPEAGPDTKEAEGVFAVRDGKSEFVPIKIGHRRRQVLRGARRGSRRAIRSSPDHINSVRGLADGDLVKVDNNREEEVNKIFESAMIALDAIWSNKLRSFLTVLGQHRGGDVDHRRGVADSGAQRVGQAGDPQPVRRRLLHRPAVRRSRAATRSSTRCAATPASR